MFVTHSAVADAAVIGLPDEDAGELPLAFVVKKPGAKVTEKELEKFIAGSFYKIILSIFFFAFVLLDQVSPPKRIRGGVVFVDSIPRNPSGKILRRHLKQTAIKMKSKL